MRSFLFLIGLICFTGCHQSVTVAPTPYTVLLIKYPDGKYDEATELAVAFSKHGIGSVYGPGHVWEITKIRP